VQVAAPGTASGPNQMIPIIATPGNLALIATYGDSACVGLDVVDSLGETWSSLPAEINSCGFSSGGAYGRFFYVVRTKGGADEITVSTEDACAFGAFAIEYAGVASDEPIDDSSGVIPTAPTDTMTAGMIAATGDDLLVAVFVDRRDAPVTMAPGSGYRELAHDDAFAALIEDHAVGDGTFTPTAGLGSATGDCWIGASVALRAK